MSRTAAILLALVILSACKEVSFREPQPLGRRALSSIPPRLQGKYLPFQANGELSRDTVIINRHGYRFGYFDPIHSNHRKDYEQGALSDSLVLKFYRGYFFLNHFNDPDWVLRVIKQEKNGDLIYMAPEQDDVDFKDYVKKLSAEIAVDSTYTPEDTLYYIDPSPAQLLDLIHNKIFYQDILEKDPVSATRYGYSMFSSIASILSALYLPDVA